MATTCSTASGEVLDTTCQNYYGHLNGAIEAVLDALSRGLTQKMLHGAMAGLNGDAERRTQTLDAVNQLFLRSKR